MAARTKSQNDLGERGGESLSSRERKLVPRERGWLEVVRRGAAGALRLLSNFLKRGKTGKQHSDVVRAGTVGALALNSDVACRFISGTLTLRSDVVRQGMPCELVLQSESMLWCLVSPSPDTRRSEGSLQASETVRIGATSLTRAL